MANEKKNEVIPATNRQIRRTYLIICMVELAGAGGLRFLGSISGGHK